MLNTLPTILIADDEPNICRIAKLIIPSEDYNVITAENGLDAYEKALQFSPNIILSDILMPKCDGFELCQKIKQNDQTADIPFIFLTGVEETQCKSRMENVNADDFLSKPFSSKLMLEKIRKYIKPVIQMEAESFTMTNDSDSSLFQFGLPDIDNQLYGHIYPQSFIMIQGPIGSGKSNITRQFIMDGIKKNQRSLLLSFETPKEKLDPIFRLKSDAQSLFHFCDASRWTHINDQPWRNIDFIYDYISNECEKFPFNRIIIDSFSNGFAFWSLHDTLKFIDLCRSLPNSENQCVLWTINQHSSIETLIYHLAHVMDIGLKTSVDNGNFSTKVEFSKWQSYNNQIEKTQTDLINVI